MTNPFIELTQLNTNALATLAQHDNYLNMFDRYTKLHPMWFICGIAATSLSAGWFTSWITHKTPPRITKLASIQKPLATQRIHKKIAPLAKESWPTINDSLSTLLTIANTIPASIVLEKLSTKPPASHTKSAPITTIAGITHNLHELLEFVIILEKKLARDCYLSYIKEQSLPKGILSSEDTCFTIYRFSLTLDA